MSVFDKLLDAVKLNDDYDEDDFLDDDFLDDEEDDFLDDEQEDKPVKKFFHKFGKKSEDDFLDDEEDDNLDSFESAISSKSSKTVAPKVSFKQEKPVRTSSKITPMRSSRKNNQQSSMEVCVIRPTSMEDTREIADTLVDDCTVILNLEGLDMELAQRIIDFTSGACYSLGGSLQKISSFIFILGPHNVDITGDLQNILGGNNSIPSARAGY